jgi:hypothetical protein
VHNVFHVSQLKEKVGIDNLISANLPILSPQGKLKVEPVAIMDRRIVKKGNNQQHKYWYVGLTCQTRTLLGKIIWKSASNFPSLSLIIDTPSVAS